MLLKKYLSRLSELSDIRLFFSRYLVNFIGLVEILCLPLLLDPGIYTEVELMRQFFLMAPLLILGAHSGYLISLYKEKRDLQLSLVIMTGLIGVGVSAVVSLMVGGLLPALAVFLMILVASMEKVLVGRGNLIVASVYKAIISGVLICFALYAYYIKLDVSALALYSGCIIVGILLWGFVIWFTSDLKEFQGSINFRRSVHEFLHLARHGFLINIQSYALIAYFIFDRIIVKSYYSDYSSEYAIGFSLSQIVFIAVNTVAFAAQQKVGENLNKFKLKDYNKMLIVTIILYAVTLVVAVPMIYLFSQWVTGYGNFVNSFILIVTFFGAYYAVSAISVIGFYQGMAMKSLYVVVFFLMLNIVMTIGLAENDYGYYSNLFKSGLLLLLSAIVFDKMIRLEFNKNSSA